MELFILAQEYKKSAAALAKKLPKLQRELKTARGKEAFLLQRRINLMRQELGETRRIMAHLSGYYGASQKYSFRGSPYSC